MRVSPEEVAARLRREDRAHIEAGRARAAAAGDRLGEAARLLRAAGAHRVWLFGSLSGDPSARPRPDSDVDLAAEGLAKERYFDVLAALMSLFDSSVDLVVLEDAPASLVERIRATGREL